MSNELVLLRNSERSTYRRCRQKWQWSYVDCFSPRRVKGALSFGTDVHTAMELYYPPGRKRGVHPARTFERLYAEHGSAYDQWDEEGNRIDALELGVTMLTEYVREYGKDDHIQIIQPELAVQIDVMDEHGSYLCTWVGKADALYKNLDLSTKARPCLGLLEHKTAKSIEEELRINSGYGEQGLSYYWALELYLHHTGILEPEQHMDHVLFNWLRKGVPDQRPQNAQGHRLNKPSKDALTAYCTAHNVPMPPKATAEALAQAITATGFDPALLGEPSKTQPKPLLHRFKLDFGPDELRSINQRIRAEAREMAHVKAGRLPVYKNPTKDCSWDCPFNDVCEIHEVGGDWRSVLDLEFDRWNPYSDHELEQEKV